MCTVPSQIEACIYTADKSGGNVAPNWIGACTARIAALELACTAEDSSGMPVRLSDPACSICSVSTSLATWPLSFTPRLRYLQGAENLSF